MIVLPATLVIIAFQAASQPSADVQKLGEDRYGVTITGLEADDRASQAVATEIAARLCGAKQPSFGRFEHKRQLMHGHGGAPEPARFRQEVTCLARSAAPAYPLVTSQPDEAATRSARAFAERFLGAFDGGDGEATWTMLADGLKAQQTQSDWITITERHRAAVGTEPSNKVVKLTWYTNPPGVQPGVYAAADYVGSSAKAALICGFVALRRTGADGWEVARVESGTAPHKAVRGASPDKLAELKSALRCV